MYRPPRRLRYDLQHILVSTILPFCVILIVLYCEPPFNAQLSTSFKQTRTPPLRVYRNAEDETILCVIPNVIQHGKTEMFVPDVYIGFGYEVNECMGGRNFQYYSGAAPKAAGSVRRYDADVLGQSFTARLFYHFAHVAMLFPQRVLVPASLLLRSPDARLPTPTCLYPDDSTVELCEHGRYALQPRILISEDVLGQPGGWVYEFMRMVTSGTMASMFKPQYLHVPPTYSNWEWESFRTLVTSPQKYELDRHDRLMRAAGISRERRCTRRVVIITRDRRRKLDRTIPASTLRRLIKELHWRSNLTIETVVDMGELAFAQQVKLMQNADVVVAVHGAEMSNILFLRPGAIVIEIHPFAYWTPGMFGSLREAMHLNYSALGSPPDRTRFLRCMKHGEDSASELARGLRIFESHEKMHRAANDDRGRWRAGAFLMSPRWARRCCRAQVVDFNATEVAQLVLRHAKSRCSQIGLCM